MSNLILVSSDSMSQEIGCARERVHLQGLSPCAAGAAVWHRHGGRLPEGLAVPQSHALAIAAPLILAHQLHPIAH